jgi:hypothetical protein
MVLGRERVPHDKLMDRMKEVIVPGRVLDLTDRFGL